jgi:uncharacterized protein YndB with AHSA1/START domain
MSAERFECRVTHVVPAPPERVWAAFATAEGFAQLYEGITVTGDWKVGGEVIWSGLWEGKTLRDVGTVLTYDKPRRFTYTYWTSFSGLPQAPESTQTLDNRFEAVPGGTQVTIHQTNIASAESRDHSAKNWKTLLEKLADRLK